MDANELLDDQPDSIQRLPETLKLTDIQRNMLGPDGPVFTYIRGKDCIHYKFFTLELLPYI